MLFFTAPNMEGAAALVLPLVDAVGDRRAGFSMVGLVFGFVMAVTALITGLSVKEIPENEREGYGEPPEGFFRTYLVVFKNRPYLFLVLTYMLHLSAISFVSGILVYYMKYMYNNEGLTTLAMVVLLFVAMACIPVSVLFSRRFGKKLTYQLAFALITVGCIGIFLFGHTLGFGFTMGMMAIAGIGVGFAYVPPFAMLPDAIELEAKTTGRRREGAYYGIWTFMAKLGQSGATALVGFILAAARYAPDVPQGPEGLIFSRKKAGTRRFQIERIWSSAAAESQPHHVLTNNFAPGY